MAEEFLPFSKPTISQAAIDEVVDCLRSGWITTGPRTQRFEEALKDYLQVPHALALTSATSGLLLALAALNLQPGDEVITSAMTFVATLNTIVQAGAKPVLVDVDISTYNMDVAKAAQAITPKTRAIVPVHFAGIPVDLDPLYELAKQHNLRVIEDAAHSIGTEYKGKRIGSFGDTQVFSFHPNKNMTTGEGGCVTTKDNELARQINLLRFHGIDRSVWNRFSKTGNQHYDVITAGYKFNMLDIQAALGLHQLPELDNFIACRTRLAERYGKLFADWPELQLPRSPSFSHKHAWHLYAPLIKPESAGIDRDTFIQKMKDHNIGIGLHYTAPHLYSFYQEKFGYKVGDFPNAEHIGKHIVSLPLFPLLTDAEQDHVVATMAKIFNRPFA